MVEPAFSPSSISLRPGRCLPASGNSCSTIWRVAAFHEARTTWTGGSFTNADPEFEDPAPRSGSLRQRVSDTCGPRGVATRKRLRHGRAFEAPSWASLPSILAPHIGSVASRQVSWLAEVAPISCPFHVGPKALAAPCRRGDPVARHDTEKRYGYDRHPFTVAGTARTSAGSGRPPRVDS
jgi:hypothetical protein